MVGTKAFLMTSVVLIAFTSTLISVALLQVHARSSSVIFIEPGQSIAQAVNNVQDGDRLVIKSGFFNESMVVVNKSLSIVGESSENTIVDGGRTAQVIFQVVANDVLIQNLTLQNTDLAPFIITAASAVTIFNATGVMIRNVSVKTRLLVCYCVPQIYRKYHAARFREPFLTEFTSVKEVAITLLLIVRSGTTLLESDLPIWFRNGIDCTTITFKITLKTSHPLAE